jgi:hypothetical protein
VFHVKRFGTIDGLHNRTFVERGAIRSWYLGQAKECGRVYLGNFVSRRFARNWAKSLCQWPRSNVINEQFKISA